MKAQFEWYRGYVYSRLKDFSLRRFFILLKRLFIIAVLLLKGGYIMSPCNGMLQEVADRIREMREIAGYSPEFMAEQTEVAL